MYFVWEVELEVGIIQFSGEKIAENQFFYRQQTSSFDIFVSQERSFLSRLAFVFFLKKKKPHFQIIQQGQQKGYKQYFIIQQYC